MSAPFLHPGPSHVMDLDRRVEESQGLRAEIVDGKGGTPKRDEVELPLISLHLSGKLILTHAMHLSCGRGGGGVGRRGGPFLHCA